MEKEKVKIELMEAIDKDDINRALQILKEVCEQGEITMFNSFYLNELVKELANLKLDDKNQLREHWKKMAYLFASRL